MCADSGNSRNPALILCRTAILAHCCPSANRAQGILSRQRPRVRVPSSPPFLASNNEWLRKTEMLLSVPNNSPNGECVEEV